MRYCCIACEVLARPVYLCAAHSPHIIDVELMKRGLHDQPVNLQTELQNLIDQKKDYDAVLLGYGLCGKATAGIKAGNIPVVIPRAHDCITLFLGSRERYTYQFDTFPGTYWYAQDYVERDDGSGASLSAGAGTDDIRSVYDEYVAKYGQDNADYLMEVMGAWQKHYKRAAYIDMGIGDGKAVQEKARNIASRRGWTFDSLAGEMVLIRRLLYGDWNDDFLVLQPGEKIEMTYDENVICGL
jgi:hypothetical protein